MKTITIERDELKELIRETFINVLTQRKDLIGNVVIEAMEDIGLGVAMQEGRTGKYIDNKEFLKKVDKKIKAAK